MRLTWNKVGENKYETGVSNGVLYPVGDDGQYGDGVAWNGLTNVTQSPSGAEANKHYADNIPYATIVSAEEFGATVEAFTSPREFDRCDGTARVNGVRISQQSRRPFGFCYKTLVGNDVMGTDYGRKLHLVYGALAAPSEKSHATMNDSPEPTGLSWELTTTPVSVGQINGVEYRPTAHLTLDSTDPDTDAATLTALEDILYGTAGADPRLPLPGEVLAMFSGAVVEVETVAPTYDNTTDIITIPNTVGVVYRVGGEPVAAGPYGPITEDTVVTATPADGYSFTETSDDDWTINFS